MEQAVIEQPKAKADFKVALPALMEVVAIKSGQDTIKLNLTALDGLIHDNAVQCLMHAEKHGDTSLMRRLLVDIIDAKSGYRRAGIIAWMRTYSPMELKGDTINLSGTDDKGLKRAWRVQEANANPFRSDRNFAEVAKPLYRDTLLSQVQSAIKKYKDAKSNTNKDGRPIDSTKPFLDALHVDKLDEFFNSVESNVVTLSQYRDNTREVAKATKALAEAQAEVEAAKVA